MTIQELDNLDKTLAYLERAFRRSLGGDVKVKPTGNATVTVTRPDELGTVDGLTVPTPAWAGRRNCVELVRVGPVHPHPTPHTVNLEVTEVHGLKTVIGRDEFQPGDIAIWLPVGTLVPTASQKLYYIHHGRPNYRVRTRSFRGVESCGVLLRTEDTFRLTDHRTGADIEATVNCWNVWLKGQVGADVSALLGMENPR